MKYMETLKILTWERFEVFLKFPSPTKSGECEDWSSPRWAFCAGCRFVLHCPLALPLKQKPKEPKQTQMQQNRKVICFHLHIFSCCTKPLILDVMSVMELFQLHGSIPCFP